MDHYLLVLLATLSTPYDAPTPPLPFLFRSHLRTIAIALELADGRECLLIGDTRPGGDLWELRYRRASLAEAPHLWELGRFPSHAEAVAGVEFNVAYRAHLGRLNPLFNFQRDAVADAVRDAEGCHERWRALRDAADPGEMVHRRRMGLAKLREALRPDDWAAGDPGMYVPLQWFREVP